MDKHWCKGGICLQAWSLWALEEWPLSLLYSQERMHSQITACWRGMCASR